MASKPGTRHTTPADTSAAVDAFFAQLQHPLKAELQTLRELILSADEGLHEGVKWNAPSFRTHEYFATFHLREKQGLSLILHLGAKARELGPEGLRIADPAQLLHWLGADRAQIRFRDAADIAARREAFVSLLREWIRAV